jgi:phage/plasmid-associated DNA primase
MQNETGAAPGKAAPTTAPDRGVITYISTSADINQPITPNEPLPPICETDPRYAIDQDTPPDTTAPREPETWYMGKMRPRSEVERMRQQEAGLVPGPVEVDGPTPRGPAPALVPVAEILRALQVVTAPGGIVEVRALNPWTASGYYDTDHLEQAAKAIEALDAAGTYDGIYITLNEINPALLSRRANRIETRLPKSAATTADADIVRRRWLPVDVDVKRPSGISSTDEEHAIALEAAGRIARYLTEEHGFPEPVRADSGNGAHLLYRIDLPNDEESRDLVKASIEALGAAFNQEPGEGRPGYEVDQTTFNAARIWKLYGTMARKGDHTPERPHRRARILEVPDVVEVVRPEALAALAGQAPREEEQPRQMPRQRFNGRSPGIDLDEWLNEYGASLPPYQAKSTPGMRSFYVFDSCPWDPSHRDRSAFVGQRTDGPLVAGCHHNGCAGRTWQDLRELVEPKQPKSRPPRPRQPPAQAQTTEEPDRVGAPRNDYTSLYTVSERGKSRLDFQRIADVLIARYEPVTFNGVVWIYSGGLYRREQGEILSFVSEVARAALFEGSLTTAVREVTAYVAAHNPTPDYPFDNYPNTLPLSNGVLIIDWEAETATLHPYAPKYRFTRRWPVAFDPDADPAPVHDQALALYVDDEEVTALYQLPAQAILQFCGFGPFKKSYIFEGPTNGGKSTYIEHFLNKLFGAENIAGVSLQEIGVNRFVSGSLENKVINRCDDLADVPLRNVGPFKTLTGGFSHQIERKHEKDYPGRITAVHCFATNMPPEVPDNVAFDSAFWGRFVYLRFNNVFEVDPGFPDRVFTPENMAGALNRILQEAFAIRTGGRLTFDQDPSGVKDEWQTAANPFERFVSSEMEPTKDPVLFDKGKLFRQFLAWCDENDISPRKVPGTLTGFTQLIFSSGFKPTRRGKRQERDQMYEARYAWRAGSRFREMI